MSDVTFTIESARREKYKVDPFDDERERIVVNGTFRRDQEYSVYDEEWYADIRNQTFEAYIFDNVLREFIVVSWGSDGVFRAQDIESFHAVRRVSP